MSTTLGYACVRASHLVFAGRSAFWWSIEFGFRFGFGFGFVVNSTAAKVDGSITWCAQLCVALGVRLLLLALFDGYRIALDELFGV